jgi:NitT/TauT family transport system ATP-binding protein
MTQSNHLVYEDVCMDFDSDAGTIRALDPFNFQIRANEFIVIVGPSGCGKSTLLHITSGLTQPSAGRVLLGGQPILEPGPDKAIVFQNFSLFPWKTVYENIDFGLRINGVSEDKRRTVIARYIKLIGLNGFERHFPRQLTGGMQQRVAIARIWQTQSPTVLFITHSVEEAVFLADRIIVMTRRPGRIKEVISPVEHMEGLDQHWRGLPYESVMGRQDFQDLRARVWNLVKSEIGDRH